MFFITQLDLWLIHLVYVLKSLIWAACFKWNNFASRGANYTCSKHETERDEKKGKESMLGV